MSGKSSAAKTAGVFARPASPRTTTEPVLTHRTAHAQENAMSVHLPADHQVTYDQLFQHPISRNLEWRHLRTLLVSLSDSVEEHAENVKFTRNGQTLVVRPPR